MSDQIASATDIYRLAQKYQRQGDLAGAATILVVPLFFFLDWLAGRLVHTALGMARVHDQAADEAAIESAETTPEAPLQKE